MSTTAKSKLKAKPAAAGGARAARPTRQAAPPSGVQQLSLHLIDEDPHQPRTRDNPGFAPESIAEIGETIRARGVKSPISVREHPTAPGRYLINHGARRYRGSKWAGKTSIPAFVDNDYNEADQVIENLQRNELTAREVADFIGRELAKGKKKGEIAKDIGKSAAFVTQHVALLDLPDPIARAFSSGRTRDVTVINELVTAHRRHPSEVTFWLEDDGQEISRGSVKLLREYLDDKRSRASDDGHDDEARAEGAADPAAPMADKGPRARTAALPSERPFAPEGPAHLRRSIVQVRHDGRPARLVTTRRPTAGGRGWVRYEDTGEEVDVELRSVKLVALLEG